MCPLTELLGDRALILTADNGEPIPYDGWVDLTFNPPGNDDPRIAIKVPFLKLDLGDGLIKVHQTRGPYVEIPVGDHTQHTATLSNSTVLGNIQLIDKIIETDQT